MPSPSAFLISQSFYSRGCILIRGLPHGDTVTYYFKVSHGKTTFIRLQCICFFVSFIQTQNLNRGACFGRLTYKLVQENERGDVARQAQQLADDHEPVPRLDGQRHHEQLGQDERGEGNGDNVDKLRVEEQQRSVHDYAPWSWK